MNWGIVSGIITAILIVAFLGVVGWAYTRSNRRRFDEAAQLALDPEDRNIDVEDMEQRK
ncbi:MAG: cbb3-type cytochrome c oxidase subunit 3 [Xanthomonadales bacterium]|nr:cbb3-type cytochrome c oxidase subunit 3 [Xanthomonadales bacterium]